jgi:hypothetical protein
MTYFWFRWWGQWKVTKIFLISQFFELNQFFASIHLLHSGYSNSNDDYSMTGSDPGAPPPIQNEIALALLAYEVAG